MTAIVNRNAKPNETASDARNGTKACPINKDSVVRAGRANETARQPKNPATALPIAPAIHAQIIGLFNLRFTPNIAGSVIPSSAVNDADNAWDLNVASFDLIATARAAPPCANTAPPNNAIIVSYPYTATLVNLT